MQWVDVWLVCWQAPPKVNGSSINVDKNDIIDVVSVFFHKLSEKNFTASIAVNKKTAEQNFRRSGGLPISTHQTGRSMTLRPHLAAGLPFRYINHYSQSHRKGKPFVTYWIFDFSHC
jgi:hypothetical protein